MKWCKEDGPILLQLPIAESYRDRRPDGHKVLQGQEGRDMVPSWKGCRLDIRAIAQESCGA